MIKGDLNYKGTVIKDAICIPYHTQISAYRAGGSTLPFLYFDYEVWSNYESIGIGDGPIIRRAVRIDAKEFGDENHLKIVELLAAEVDSILKSGVTSDSAPAEKADAMVSAGRDLMDQYLLDNIKDFEGWEKINSSVP